MKVMIAAILVFSTLAHAATLNDCVNAIHQQESGGKKSVPDNPNDNGLALGPYQIHYKCWQDAVEYDKSIGGTYADCRDDKYSEKIVKAYLKRYASRYIAAQNWNAVARIYNGGPSGYRHESTARYGREVVARIKNQS